MKIDTSEWNYFDLVDLFDIVAGNYHYKSEYSHGTTPYVTASNTNNAISEYIDLEPEFKGNCIVTGKVGCTAFYQKYNFCATSDVNIFIPKFNMSENIGLFIATIINISENYKWGYGRQCRVRNSKKISIKLPSKKGKKFDNITVRNNIIPDFEYMEKYIEKYIKSLKTEYITTNNKIKNNIKIDAYNWGKFKVRDIFDIYNGKGITQEEIEENSGDFIVVQSGSENNGVLGCIDLDYCKKMDYIYTEEMCLTVARSGSAGYVSFQKNGCVVGDSAKILKLKSHANIYCYLFIKTILMANKYKYTYGRKVTKDNYLELVISLPVKRDKSIDWGYMENYIKSLPYGDII